MTSSPQEPTLPFFGFADTKEFSALSQRHSILFRLHTSLTSTPPSPEHTITAPMYSTTIYDNLRQLPDIREGTPDAQHVAELARHLRAYREMSDKRGQAVFPSPWLSTTFSLPWVIWEAQRRLAYRFSKGACI